MESEAFDQEADQHQGVSIALSKNTLNFISNGTSFVSLYIPAKENLDKINALLTGELSGATQIKSRQTRQSVLSAITSTKESK